MSREIPSYEAIKNETLYDIDNRPDFIDYEAEVPMLRCGACGRRNIKSTASKCPQCRSFDLIEDNPAKSITTVFR